MEIKMYKSDLDETPSIDRIEKLESELLSLKEKLLTYEHRDKRLTEKFEKTHLVGSDMQLTPGANAILANAMRNKILSWITVFTIVGALGFSATIKTVFDSLDKAIEIAIKSSQEDISIPLLDIYSEQFKKVNEDILNYKKKLGELGELSDATQQAIDAKKRLNDVEKDIYKAQKEMDEVKDEYINNSKKMARSLSFELLKNPDLVKSITTSINREAKQKWDSLSDIKNNLSWKKLNPPVLKFNPECDYRIDVKHGRKMYSYHAAYVRNSMLTFHFEAEKYYKVDSYNVPASDLKTYNWSDGVYAGKRNGVVYERCIGQS